MDRDNCKKICSVYFWQEILLGRKFKRFNIGNFKDGKTVLVNF